MSEYNIFLVTLYYEDDQSLVECVIKAHYSIIDYEEIYHWGEKENRDKIHALLPMHVRSVGPIVAVKPIFECVVLEGKEEE